MIIENLCCKWPHMVFSMFHYFLAVMEIYPSIKAAPVTKLSSSLSVRDITPSTPPPSFVVCSHLSVWLSIVSVLPILQSNGQCLEQCSLGPGQAAAGGGAGGTSVFSGTSNSELYLCNPVSRPESFK